MEKSSLSAFGFALKWWIFIFITVLLPFDFLYRVGSLLEGLSPLQIEVAFSSVVVFFVILGLTIAFLSLVFSWLFTKINFNGTEIINKTNAILGIFCVIIFFSEYLWAWIKEVLKFQTITGNLRLSYIIISGLSIVLIAGIIFLVRKCNNIINNISSISRFFAKINIFIIIISATSLLLFGFISLNDSQKKIWSFDEISKNNHRSYPNIILITFDAFAAQHSSLYGYHYKTTPNIDKLGQESYVFDNMYSSSNWTLPSFASLMTGKYPNHHGLIKNISYFWRLGRKQNIAFLLKEIGYETAVVWSNPYGCPWNNNIKGFERVAPNNTSWDFYYVPGLGPNSWLSALIGGNHIYKLMKNFSDIWQKEANKLDVTMKAEFTFDQASKLLTDIKSPFFLWIHIFPPHDPYLSNRIYRYSILKEKIFDNVDKFSRAPELHYPPKDQPLVDKLSMRYDENLLYADDEFGKFLTFLTQRGLFDKSILIVSSDHGEMFEKGFRGHGGPYLYQPLIHVPLIIHLPGETRGQRIGINVSHVDIAPTILDILGVKPPMWMDGRSFKAALEGSNIDIGIKYSMNLGYVNCPSDLKTRSFAAIKQNYKLIKYSDWHRYELYDVKKDPQEKLNLIAKKPEIFSSLKAEIDHTFRN